VSAKILVVDDSAIVRRVAVAALTKAGHRVVSAANVEAATVEVAQEVPHLVVLDDVLGDSDPRDLLRYLHTAAPGVPVVVLATKGTSALMDGTLHSFTIVDALSKPFAADALVAVVEHWLRKAPQAVSDHPFTAAATEVIARPPSMTQALADVLSAHGVREADNVAALVAEELRAKSGLHTAWSDDGARPALSGDLSAVPLPEVLQLLKFQSQTGVVDVRLDTAPPVRFSMLLVDGAVVGLRAINARADLLLGRYFVTAGYVEESTLNQALAEKSTVPVGERLCARGLLTPEQLRRCLIEQAQELMYELLRARSGSFALRRGLDVITGPRLEPGLGIDALLFEGLRRVDEWQVIEREVPSLSARFVRASSDTTGLSEDEAALLLAVPTGKEGSTVASLAMHMQQRPFDTSKLLYRLIMLKRIQRVSHQERAIDDDLSESALPTLVLQAPHEPLR
jgi:DNA-binding response OmpR family regulator